VPKLDLGVPLPTKVKAQPQAVAALLGDTDRRDSFQDAMEAAANGAAKKASAAAAIAEAAERLIGVKVEDPAEAARLRRLRRNKQQSVLEEEEKVCNPTLP